MQRRYSGLKGNIAYFLVFLVLAVICHFVPPEVHRLGLSLYPIPLIVVIYLGYKMGKWVGLAAGLLAPLSWLAISANTGTPPDVLIFGGQLELADGSIGRIVGSSIQHILFGAAFGFASGALFDLLEKRLAEANLSLDELLPVRNRSVLMAIYQYLQRWFVLLSEGPLKGGEGSFTDVLLRQVGKLAIVFVIVILAVLNLNFSDGWGLGPLSIGVSFPPSYLAGALILAYAFATGSRAGVLATFALWIATIILIALPLMGGLPSGAIAFIAKISPTLSLTAEAADMATKAVTKGMEGRRLALVITSPAQAIGLAILAWWAGKAGEIYRDTDRLSKLTAVWPLSEVVTTPKPAPSFAMALIVTFLTLWTSASLEPFRIIYDPILVVFLATAIWANRCDHTLVSNRIFWTLLFLSTIWLSGYYDSLNFGSYRFNAYRVFLLALTPLVVARLDLSRRGNCRLVAYGFLIAITIPDLYLRGYFPHTYILSAQYDGDQRFTIFVLSWPLTILFTEFAARLLHRIASPTSRRHQA